MTGARAAFRTTLSCVGAVMLTQIRSSPRLVALLALVVATTACSQVSSYAVPTTGTPRAPRVGAVYVYASRPVPAGSTELGIVEARGYGPDMAIDKLFPELVRRAQELGGNAVVVDWMGMGSELVTTMASQPSQYPCGTMWCTRWETYPETREQVFVRVRGRALTVAEPAKEGE